MSDLSVNFAEIKSLNQLFIKFLISIDMSV